MNSDYTLEAITKFVRKTYPDETGELSVTLNYSTSSIFAYASFTQGKDGDEVELQDISILSYYGLPIKVQKMVVLKEKQVYATANKIEDLSIWRQG